MTDVPAPVLPLMLMPGIMALVDEPEQFAGHKVFTISQLITVYYDTALAQHVTPYFFFIQNNILVY